MKKFYIKLFVILMALAVSIQIVYAEDITNEISWNINETYENGGNTVIPINTFHSGLKPQNGNASVVLDPTGEKGGNVLATTYAPNGTSAEGIAIDTRFPFGKFAPGEIKAIEFDIYTTKDAYLLFSVRTAGWGWGTQGLISKNGYVTISKNMSSDGMNVSKWQSSNIYGLLSKSKSELIETGISAADFTSGEWHTVKMVLDTKNKIDYLYLDGSLVGQVAEQFTDATYFQITNLTHVEKNETLFYIDNLKMGSVQKVSRVFVTDFSENSYESGEEIPRDIASVNISFSVPAEEESMTADTVKVLCNGELVEYSVEGFDSKTNTYSIIPKILPKSGDILSVEIADVKAKAGGKIAPYNVDFTVMAGEGSFGILPVSFVDSSGVRVENPGVDEAFVKASFVNTTDLEKKVIICAVAYKDGMMVKVSQNVITVPQNTVYNISESENTLKLTGVLDADRICIMIQNGGDLRYPLTDVVWVE